MIPDDIPDMDNPEVLELVLCLLEVDDGRFAELGGKCDTPLPYNMPIQLANSPIHMLEQILLLLGLHLLVM